MNNNRKIKVVAQSSARRFDVPTIILKGLWLQNYGFEPGEYVDVSCGNGQLIITRREADKAKGS